MQANNTVYTESNMRTCQSFETSSSPESEFTSRVLPGSHPCLNLKIILLTYPKEASQELTLDEKI